MMNKKEIYGKRTHLKKIDVKSYMMDRMKRKGDIHKERRRNRFLKEQKRRKNKQQNRHTSPCKIPYIPTHTLENVDPHEPILQNTVSVQNTKLRVDQTEISMAMCPFEHQNQKFAATTIRLLENGTVLLYKTGKFIVVGTPSYDVAHINANHYLQQIGNVRKRIFVINSKGKVESIQFLSISVLMDKLFPDGCPEMKIQNTVFKCEFKEEDIFLNELQHNTQEFSAYVPESFPGVRITGKRCTFLVFQQGSCLILGLKTSGLHKSKMELLGYITRAKQTRIYRNELGRYIWRKNSSLIDVKSNDKEGKTTTQVSTQIMKPPPRHTLSKNENFEKRLKDNYSWGKYNKSLLHNDDGKSDEEKNKIRMSVLHSTSVDDFNPRLDNMPLLY